MGIPEHLTCLLRNLYAGEEATVRTGHGPTDWSQIGKGIHQGCILSPCLFNLHAEYIMRNTGLDEAQAGIKIARRNINNLRYADDTTLIAETKEELKNLLMKMKEESEKFDFKLNIQKTKIMASGSITPWQIDGGTVETVADFIFLGSKITADGDCSHEIKRRLLLGRILMTNLDSILKSKLIWFFRSQYSWADESLSFLSHAAVFCGFKGHPSDASLGCRGQSREEKNEWYGTKGCMSVNKILAPFCKVKCYLFKVSCDKHVENRSRMSNLKGFQDKPQ